MRLELPYGREPIILKTENAAVIRSRIDELAGDRPGREIVEEAMAHPIGSPRLEELAVGKKDAVVIISDHTRPVPSRDILPPMLAALRRGNPDIDITLLVATGCHRGTRVDELERKLGSEILLREKIVVHDAQDPASNVEIGTLPSGARLVIDRLAAETELLVAEGFIEPHFFAGFSGGRKSVLPGICDRVTVLGNHCGAFIADEHARTGVLKDNPIHRDMVEAARMARLAYIVNVVINEKQRTAAAFAGDFEQAHLAGTKLLSRYCRVRPVPADIVVTTNGGAPLDQNLYQCVKGLTAAEACVKPGGTIILCAEMADGAGGDFFYRLMRDCASPAVLYEEFGRVPQDETVPDQWQVQILCRVLMRARVIFVTRPEMRRTIEEMKMEYAPDIDTALSMAGTGSLTVIPNGISVMVAAEEEA